MSDLTIRKQKADTVLAMVRAGKKVWQIAREVGVTDRHVLQVLDAFRLLGVDTAPGAPDPWAGVCPSCGSMHQPADGSPAAIRCERLSRERPDRPSATVEQIRGAE